MNRTVDKRIHKLFKELVPLSGKAESLAGEIVRAVNRIDYRFYNDGDQLGIGYGKETCNPAGRFLIAKTNPTIAILVEVLWRVSDTEAYGRILDVLLNEVANYVEAHPELRNQETPDMFSFRNEKEDIDRYDEEDE